MHEYQYNMSITFHVLFFLSRLYLPSVVYFTEYPRGLILSLNIQTKYLIRALRTLIDMISEILFCKGR